MIYVRAISNSWGGIVCRMLVAIKCVMACTSGQVEGYR